jgi:hypothetical protein
MKRGALRTLFTLTLLLGLAAAAAAQDNPWCSTARVAGVWGYTKTGTLYLPNGTAAPFGSVGTFTLDADGYATGTQLASVAGNIAGGELDGTFTIEPDCTGSMTVGVYDPSGNLLRTISMSIVVDDKASELRALVTSLVLPNGMVLPAVITGQARRLFPSPADED